MSIDPALLDRDALEKAMETARVDRLAAHYAEEAADRRYLERFVAYERMASTLRRTLRCATDELRAP